MVDANKTPETKRVTELAAAWLKERGFKPVESEVSLSDKWIADLAGVGSLTRTEAMRLKILRQRPSWKPECRDDYDRWHGEFEALPGILTAAVEVKASMSDFVRDDKWSREPVTHLLYVAMPVGILSKVFVPEHVGILACKDSIRCARKATVRDVDDTQSLRVVHQIAVRRDHFTAYERSREFMRQAREHDNERSNKERLKKLVCCCIDVLDGKRTPAEVLGWYGVKVGEDRSVVLALERLAAMRSPAGM